MARADIICNKKNKDVIRLTKPKVGSNLWKASSRKETTKINNVKKSKAFSIWIQQRQKNTFKSFMNNGLHYLAK